MHSLLCGRVAVFSLVWTVFVRAEVPAQDSRNTQIVGTDTHFKAFVYGSRADWDARKAVLKNQILSSAGLLPLPVKSALHPRVFGRVERKGYSIEKVYIESFPGYYLCGNLFRPLHPSPVAPGILVAHGHFAYGRLEHQQLDSGPVLGANLAEQGYVVFAYDMVGYNDTSQTPHSFGGPHEMLWSFSPLGLQLWNSIRALDFLESLSGVDPKRIGMTGASGGGTQTFLLAAVDERVRYSAVVNMVSAEMQGGDICENAPGLRVDTYNVEVAAMMAPRPLLLVSTSGDWTKNAKSEVYPAIRRVYELYGKADVFRTADFNFPHNYNHESRMAAYAFFRGVLAPDWKSAEPAEDEDAPEQLPKMLVFYDLPMPQGAKNYNQLFEYWRRCGISTAKTMTHKELAGQFARVLGAEWPMHVESEMRGQNIILSRTGRGDRVPGILLGGKNATVVVVHPEGSGAAAKSDSVRALLAQGHSVLCIDAFQTGAAKAPRGDTDQFFLTFNRSDDANRVQDILTALAFVSSKSEAEIHLRGIGQAAIWCLFAAVISPNKVLVDSNLKGFDGSDEQLLHNFRVPGIQKAGGIPAALKILESR